MIGIEPLISSKRVRASDRNEGKSHSLLSFRVRSKDPVTWDTNTTKDTETRKGPVTCESLKISSDNLSLPLESGEDRVRDLRTGVIFRRVTDGGQRVNVH